MNAKVMNIKMNSTTNDDKGVLSESYKPQKVRKNEVRIENNQSEYIEAENMLPELAKYVARDRIEEENNEGVSPCSPELVKKRFEVVKNLTTAKKAKGEAGSNLPTIERFHDKKKSSDINQNIGIIKEIRKEIVTDRHGVSPKTKEFTNKKLGKDKTASPSDKLQR